jgi:hypothetical protein
MAVAVERVPTVIVRARSIPAPVRDWTPRSRLGLAIFRALPHLPPDLAAELLDRIQSAAIIESSLRIRVIRGLGLWRAGLLDEREVVLEDHGIVSRKVVTTAAVNAIVDSFENTFENENWDFHGIGTGTNAEAVGDTALQTELTTQYNPDNTRATGTPSQPSANIYRTLGTNTLDSGTPAVTEHGIFTQAATGGGTLLDRSVFSSIDLNGANGDGMQTTYDITFTAGS